MCIIEYSVSASLSADIQVFALYSFCEKSVIGASSGKTVPSKYYRWVLKCRYSYFTFRKKKWYWWIPSSIWHRTLSPAEIRHKKKIQTTFYLFTTVADRPAKVFPEIPKLSYALLNTFLLALRFFFPLLKWRKWKIGEKKPNQLPQALSEPQTQ